MKRIAQALLTIVALTVSAAGWADERTEANQPRLHLPVIGYVRNVGPEFVQFSRDMKYIASDDAIQETATGTELWRLWSPRQSQGFFSHDGKPCIMAPDIRGLKTTIFEFPGHRPALVIPGRKRMWATVLRKPLHDALLLIAPTSEEAGRVEVWDLDSLARLLEIHDEGLCADLLEPLEGREWLAVSRSGNRLVWLAPNGDLYVWDLRARTGTAMVIPGVASARNANLNQVLRLSPDGSHAAIVDYSGRQRNASPASTVELPVVLVQLSDRIVSRIRFRVPQLSLSTTADLFFSPGGREVVLIATRCPTSVCDIRTGECLRSYESAALWHNNRFMLSPDAYALANGDYRGFCALPNVGGIRAPSARSSRLWQNVSPDGFYLVPYARNRLIEAASGRELLFGDGEKQNAFGYSFSPDGRFLLHCCRSPASADDRFIAVLDLHNFTPDLAKDGDRGMAQWLSELASSDATRAQVAVRRLAQSGDSVVAPLLALVRYEAVPPRIRELVKKLDHDELAVRERASNELGRLGRLAEDQLLRVISESASPEATARARRILSTIDASAECGEVLSQLRALQVLVILHSDGAMDAIRQLRQCALSARVRAAADLNLFRLEFR